MSRRQKSVKRKEEEPSCEAIVAQENVDDALEKFLLESGMKKERVLNMDCFRQLVTYLHSQDQNNDGPTEELGYDLYKTTTEGDVYVEGEQYEDYNNHPTASDSQPELVTPKVEDMPFSSGVVVKEECPDEEEYNRTISDCGDFDLSRVKAEEEEYVEQEVTGVIPEGTVAIPREMVTGVIPEGTVAIPREMVTGVIPEGTVAIPKEMEREDGRTVFARLVRRKLEAVSELSIGKYLLNTPFVEPGPNLSPCIICTEPVASYHGLRLNVNLAVKLLMAAVMSGIVELEDAAKRVMVNPLRMCKSHTHFMYDWMSYATGCNSAESLEEAPIEKIQSSIGVYRDLKKLREYQDGQLRRFTPLWSFKHAIRSYFRAYATKYPGRVPVAQTSPDKNKKKVLSSPVKRIFEEVPPSTSLQEILKAQNIVLNQDEQKHLLEALRIPERQPRKLQPRKPKDKSRRPKNKLDALTDAAIAAIPENMKNKSSSSTEPEYWTARSQSPEVAQPGPDDHYFQHHKTQTSKVRQERYKSYPEEIRKMMAPIDQFYDQGSGANRSKITAIREQKRKNPDPQPVAKKRTRAAPINFTKLAQQMMQKIDSRSLSDSTSNDNAPSTSAQSSSAPGPSSSLPGPSSRLPGPSISAFGPSSSLPVPSISAPVPAPARPARKFPDPTKYMRVVPKPGQTGAPKYVLRPGIAQENPVAPKAVNTAPIPDWIQALPVIPDRRRQPEHVACEDYQRPQYVEDKPSIDQDWRPQHDVLQGEKFYKAGFDTHADFVHYGYEVPNPEIETSLINPSGEGKPDYVQLGQPASQAMVKGSKPERVEFNRNGVNIKSNGRQKSELTNLSKAVPMEDKPDVQPKTMYDRKYQQNLTLFLKTRPAPKEVKPEIQTFLSRRKGKMDKEEERFLLKLKSRPVEKLELRPRGGVAKEKAPEVKNERRTRLPTSQDTQLPGYHPNMTCKELMQARLKAQRLKLYHQKHE